VCACVDKTQQVQGPPIVLRGRLELGIVRTVIHIIDVCRHIYATLPSSIQEAIHGLSNLIWALMLLNLLYAVVTLMLRMLWYRVAVVA